MTDAELIYLLRMHISDIKWHREPDLSEGTVKVLGEAVDAIAARLAQPMFCWVGGENLPRDNRQPENHG